MDNSAILFFICPILAFVFILTAIFPFEAALFIAVVLLIQFLLCGLSQAGRAVD